VNIGRFTGLSPVTTEASTAPYREHPGWTI
jgi:hypothetical protein